MNTDEFMIDMNGKGTTSVVPSAHVRDAALAAEGGFKL